MNTLSVVRRWLLAALVLGLVGSGVELVLLEHYETAVQFVPPVSTYAAPRNSSWRSIDRKAAGRFSRKRCAPRRRRCSRLGSWYSSVSWDSRTRTGIRPSIDPSLVLCPNLME